MLKVNFDSHKGDYLDYLIPFTKYVIASGRIAITPQTVSDAIAAEFGLEIPLFVTEKVLKRLVKRKTLKREDNVFLLQSVISTETFEERRNSIKRDYQQVCNALCEYVSQNFQVKISEDDAAYGVFKCIEHFSIEYLQSFRNGRPLGSVSFDSNIRLEYFASHFIKAISQSQSHLFASLVNLAKGKMLSNALLCDDLTSTSSKFQSVTFFVDSPLLLRLLDLDSPEHNRTAIELHDALKALKGEVKVFRHSVLEAENVLFNASERFSDPRQVSGIVPELRKRGWNGSDLQMFAANLEGHVEKLNIPIENAPHYDPKFQIDEAALEKELSDRLNYRNPKAAAVDVNSVRSIYALRRGTEPTCIEKSRAVFVTHNPNFSRVSFEFGRTLHSSIRVPAVITDYSLLNLAWLKSPLRSDDLPAIQLVSNCAAALEPTVPLWDRYLDEVEKLRLNGNISADDHQLLRYSPIVRGELMDLTVGSELQLSTDTVSTILKRAKDNLTQEKDIEIAALKNLIDSENESKVNAKEKLFRKAKKESEVATRTMFVLISVLIAVVSVVSGLKSIENTIIGSIVTGLGLVLSIISSVFGFSAHSFVEGIRINLFNRRFKSLCELVGISYSESDRIENL